MTTLLLDADILAFRIASVSQKLYQFGEDCEPSLQVDDWEDVTPRIDYAIAKLQEDLDTQEVIVCLSCPTAENWRLDILPSYKGKRDYSKRPVHLAAIKDYMEANWPSYRRPTLEADDIMGILSTDPGIVPGKKIIVSSDKDMKTIPGWLFNPDHPTKPIRIPEDEANWWHLYQAICGDAVDCYAGCPGAGPVIAWKTLDGLFGDYSQGDVWQAVVELYESKGYTEADALVQARVARICRSSDYDFSAKRVTPWRS